MPWSYTGPTSVQQQSRLIYPLQPGLTATGQAIQDTTQPAIKQALFAVSMPMTHTDGRTFLYTEPAVPDLSVVPKLIADWLRQYNKVDAAPTVDEASLPAAIDALVNPPSPPAQTADDLARIAYQQAKQVLVQVQDLVTNGVIAADDPSVATAQAAVVAAGAPVAISVATAATTLATNLGVATVAPASGSAPAPAS